MSLRLGIPTGNLEKATLDLLASAGLEVYTSPRSHLAGTSDPGIECLRARVEEMARYVAHGALDAGITGLDWVLESELEVRTVSELARAGQSHMRWVLVVPEDSPFSRPEDLAGRTVATELVAVVSGYFASRGIPARVEFSWGATEAKLPALVDAIVETAETNDPQSAGRPRLLDTVLESTTQLIANRASWQKERLRRRIEDLALMLGGALEARGRVGLMLNVRSSDLPRVLSVLPALNQPTVSALSDDGWVAVNTVIEERRTWEVLPCLKAARAEGIVEYPLNKVVS